MADLFQKIQEPGYWAKAWEEARNSSEFMKRKIRNEKETNAFWNRFASRYEKRSSPESGKDRVNKVVSLLEQKKILTKETSVLDIGSGPGTYALPFAKKCREVTALDGAREMCRELEKKAGEQSVSKIKVLNRMWQDIDLEMEGMTKGFDLVFASLSPAISDFETLSKMNRASRKNCCLITAASEAHNQARRDLWEILLKEKYNGNGMSIIYPFNLLFSLGYFPSLEYFDADQSRTDPVDEAIERLCATFWLFTDITSEIKDTIANYVREKSVNQVFYQEIFVRLGIITWQV